MSRNRLQSDGSSADEEPFPDETLQLLGADSDENEDALIEGEELINDNMEREYVAIPELDVYEDAGIDDDSSVAELSDAGRLAVEAELNRRDMTEGRIGAMRRSMIPDIFDDESSDMGLSSRQRRMHHEFGDTQISDSQPFESIENLEDTRGVTLKEWVKQPGTKNEIRVRFLSFLRTHLNEEGNSVYAELISNMVEENNKSLVVNYEHLVDSVQTLAYFLPEAPLEMLDIFDEVAYEVTLGRYPRYKHITDTIHVRISNLPLKEELRSLRQVHMSQLVRTHGVVSSCSNVLPKLKLVKYNCVKCGCIIGPFSFIDGEQVKPSSCLDCQSRGPFDVNVQNTIYKNYQKIMIQESPGNIPGGRIPRSMQVILTDDLVDNCKPGDELDITGTFVLLYDRALNNKQRFPIFSTHIHANYLEKKDSIVAFNSLNDEDLKKLRNLSKDERIFERIVRSIAPSVYGHDDIKRAIALSLFGGVAKKSDSHKVRGDINILLCGDPGTAKSQFLKFVEKLAPRSVFTTGQGASAVGLTANVNKSVSSKEFTLEAGALVLADTGVCLIDEFDKMNDRDRTSIHEAMEQQTISISKAGIVSTLQARTTIIAAANPIGGHYDISRNFSDNVDLSSPILSRFDVICVVRDVVDPVQDGMLARYVIGSHMRHHPRLKESEKAAITEKLRESGSLMASSDSEMGSLEAIPIDLLRKYIIYAKGRSTPRLESSVEKRFPAVYAELRRISMDSGGVDVTMRYLESMVRLAEAHAKLHVREVITDEDVNMAMRITLESFISTEKLSVRRQLEKKFDKYLSYKKSDFDLLAFILKQVLQDTINFGRGVSQLNEENRTVEITEKKFRERTNNINVAAIRTFLNSQFFRQQGFSYDGGKKLICFTF